MIFYAIANFGAMLRESWSSKATTAIKATNPIKGLQSERKKMELYHVKISSTLALKL